MYIFEQMVLSIYNLYAIDMKYSENLLIAIIISNIIVKCVSKLSATICGYTTHNIATYAI